MIETPQNTDNQTVAGSPGNFTSIESVPRVARKAPRLRNIPCTLSFKLYPSVWFALSLMSLVGVVAVFLHYLINQGPPVPPTPTGPQSNATHIAAPPLTEKSLTDTEEPSSKESNFSSNIDLIARNCAKMVTRHNSFAVFEHGTCVLLIEPLEDPVVSARSTLKLLSNPNIKFEVQALNNNNYLIIFDKYLFCWLFADQLAKNKDAIMRDKRLAKHPNDPPSVRSLPEIQSRIGKLARLCLVADSQNLVIKKIIRAKQPETKPNSSPSVTDNTTDNSAN